MRLWRMLLFIRQQGSSGFLCMIQITIAAHQRRHFFYQLRGNGGCEIGFMAMDISFIGLSSAAIRFELK